MYDYFLQEQGENKLATLRILQMVLYSSRPVSVVEVAEILGVDALYSEKAVFKSDLCPKPPTQAVLNRCIGFVSRSLFDGQLSNMSVMYPFLTIMVPGKDLILAHNSVEDYLVALPTVDGWFSFEEKLSHSIIAKTCLTYFTTIFSRREFDTEDEKKYPFARYSGIHWPYRVGKAEEAFTDADMMSMKAIFHEPLFSAWFTISETGAWTQLLRHSTMYH